MVTYHAPILVAHVRPYGQDAVHALAVVGEHRVHDVAAAVAADEVEQRVQCPVGIPDRENGIIVEIPGLVYLVVDTAVFTVRIHIDRRVYHRVVERRIEHTQRLVAALGFNYRHLLLPLACGVGRRLVERAPASLGTQVGQRPARSHGRQRHLDLERCGIVAEIEVHHDATPADFGEVTLRVELPPASAVIERPAVARAVFAHGLGEAHGKIGVVGARPSAGDAVARHQRVVLDTHLRPAGLALVVVDAVVEVENQVLVFARRIGVFVQAHPLGGGQLGPDAVVVEHHLVITRRCAFALVREARAVARFGVFGRAAFGAYLPHGRHQQDVAQVGVPRAAQMCVREADDRRVVVLVSGAVAVGLGLVLAVDVVRHHLRVGAQLHDAVRHAGPGENVPHAAGAYHRVDVVRRRACLRGGRNDRAGRNQGNQVILHNCHFGLLCRRTGDAPVKAGTPPSAAGY